MKVDRAVEPAGKRVDSDDGSVFGQRRDRYPSQHVVHEEECIPIGNGIVLATVEGQPGGTVSHESGIAQEAVLPRDHGFLSLIHI